MKLCPLLLALLLAATHAQTDHPITRIGHKQVRSIVHEERVQNFATYKRYLNFQPSISVDREKGCDVFAAIHASKPYVASGGLDTGGHRNGQCSRSPGKAQVYVRHRTFREHAVIGIMYSYYFPKDQNVWGGGHRHDWEDVIVWVHYNWFEKLGTSVSGHGDYVPSLSLDKSRWCDDHPLVKYRPGRAGNIQGAGNHQFMHNKGSGCPGSHSHQIACYTFMSKEHKYTLANAGWGKASPKIVDAQFNSVMDKALQQFLLWQKVCASSSFPKPCKGFFCGPC